MGMKVNGSGYGCYHTPFQSARSSLRCFATLRFEMPCDLSLGVQIQIEIKLEVIKMAQIIETTGKNGVTVSVIWNGKRAYFSCVKDATDWLAEQKRKNELERIEVFLRQIVLMARKEYKYESCYSL